MGIRLICMKAPRFLSPLLRLFLRKKEKTT